MSGKGKSSVKDEMPPADNFFATLDTDGDEEVQEEVTPKIQIADPPQDGMQFDEFGNLVQEADRLERPPAEPSEVSEKDTKDKSDEELVQALERNTKAFEELSKTASQRPPEPAQKPNPSEQPQSLAEYLFGKEGAQNFVYDPDEAVNDANSDSAKYDRARIAMAARREIERSREEDAQASAEEQFKKEKKELMEEVGMSETEFNAFEQEAAQYPVSLKDIYFMIHRSEFAENVAKNTVKQFSKQRATMSNISPTLANRGGQEIQQPSDSQFFAGVFGINNRDFETTID